MKKLIMLLLIASIGLGLAGINKNLSNSPEETTYEKANVVRVVDGDTIIVTTDGDEERVRMIGIDTPESVASEEYLKKSGKKNTKAGKEASNYTKSILKKGSVVYLEKDKSNKDAYDRLLRYVWIEKPDKINKKSIKEKMVNGILVSKGYAKAKEYKPNTKYSKIFKSLE